MNVRTLWIAPLLMACGGGSFSGHDGSEGSDAVFVSDVETDVGTDVGTDSEDTEVFEQDDVPGVDVETDTDGFEQGDLPGTPAGIVTDEEVTDEKTDPVERVDALIEDFEDGIQSFADQDRIRWSRDVQTQDIGGSYVSLYEEKHPAEPYEHGYAAHLLAEDIQGSSGMAYIQGSMVVADRRDNLVGTYAGLQFSACGKGAPVVRMMSEVTGTNCGLVSYTVHIELTDTWQVYEVAWADIEESWYNADIANADEATRLIYAQNAGCNAVPVLGESFEPASFRGVQFELDYPTNTSIDLWVDDVAFLGGDVAGIEGEPCPN